MAIRSILADAREMVFFIIFLGFAAWILNFTEIVIQLLNIIQTLGETTIKLILIGLLGALAAVFNRFKLERRR